MASGAIERISRGVYRGKDAPWDENLNLSEVLARVPLGEPSYATPAVSDGIMYLRTRSHLFSLGGKMP